MKQTWGIIIALTTSVTGCAFSDEQGTLSELNKVEVDLVDTRIEGGLDKAMQSYQKFLEQTPESGMTPEAIRRLADLKVEREYGVITDDEIPEPDFEQASKAKPELAGKVVPKVILPPVISPDNTKKKPKSTTESDKTFEQRATAQSDIEPVNNNSLAPLPGKPGEENLENAGAAEAIVLYQKLLEKYPLYERNDQVLYQLSRAYEETGQVDEAMGVMNRLYKQFPGSRYLDEVHFRRGEYYFTRKKYLDAEEAYSMVLKYGVSTVYFERALYKKGWTFYKQELYEEAIGQFIALLDEKVKIGFDFNNTDDPIQKKRVDDTFRVISLAFSNLGGAESIQEYFSKSGSRSYEDSVYKSLAEFYFSKRRYSDAATTYDAFVERNPFHKVSPHFSMRVIEIYLKGGFPRLVIKGKKQFAKIYGLNAVYWNYFNKSEYPEVLGYLKSNIFDLANHYHSLYQKKSQSKNKKSNYKEAIHWYREYITSFPKDKQTPIINYQFADLYLENKSFDLSAIEYERSAYDYALNENSHKAAYAAVFSHREYLKVAPPARRPTTKREIIRSSLRLVDTYPTHEKATIVLGAAVDDLFAMRDFVLAVKSGRRLIAEYPGAKKSIIRGAWLVVAHSSFDLKNYNDAELAYVEVLALTDKDNKKRVKLVDNLAASVYKQGEIAKEKGQFRVSVRHFLRIAGLAPHSEIRQAAEYDAAAVLMQIKDLDKAAEVLLAFRKNYPENTLQKDVTKKIAFVYKELKKYSLAAVEFEKIAAESKEKELIRDALLIAADMYDKAKDIDNTLRLHKLFVKKFPVPIEFALETYNKISLIYKAQKDNINHLKTLRKIIKIDANAGKSRSDRTRYLAANASLVLIEPDVEKFTSIKLTNPLKKSINKKKKSMKSLVKRFNKLVAYEVADVTAASTYYLAEIYYNFNRSLLESEKPKNLSDLEVEEFIFALEEQAYPFEEKSITVHEKNVELLALGIYSSWIDRSIEKLAKLLPARYAKSEETTGFINEIGYFRYIPKHLKDKFDGSSDITAETGVESDAIQTLKHKNVSVVPVDGIAGDMADNAETGSESTAHQTEKNIAGAKK